MNSILHVKNFGPIKDAKLDLRSVNVLIGPQASGKSTLAKLFTICKSPVMYFELKEGRFANRIKGTGYEKNWNKPSYNQFLKSLQFYSLDGYLNDNFEIIFECPTHSVRIIEKSIKFQDNLKIDELLKFHEKNELQKVNESILELREKSSSFNFNSEFEIFMEEIGNDISPDNEELFSNEYLKYLGRAKKDSKFSFDEKHTGLLIDLATALRWSIYNNDAIYIPAERTIVSLIKQASLNFQKSNIPLPGHLLDYAAKFEAAAFSKKEFNLGFLCKNVIYKNVNGEDRIYFNKKESIRLTDSASGFQSVIPMLLPLGEEHIDLDSIWKHSSFVIEEPETNLFPSAQYEVLKYIERSRKNDFGMIDQGTMHIYTTHSPFILTSLNNMLFAFKKGRKADKSIKEEIGNVIPKENWINPNDFSAYEIKNGKAKSIFSRKTGLINETVIDVVSEDIMNDFRKIAVISAEANVDK